MSNIVKVGSIEVNLDGLKGLSRSDIDKMYAHKTQEWRDALWSHVAPVEKPKKKKQPKKEEE